MAFSAHDIVPDSPTNNFATWNPLAVSTATFSNGNLNATMSSSVPAKITSTFAVSSGKYYMELEFKGDANYPVGISADAIQQNYLGVADGNTSISFWPGNSQTELYINGVVQSFSGSTTTWASGDIIGIKLDADNEEVSIYKNGNLVGSSVSYSSYGWAKAFFAAGNYINGQQFNINTGQDPTFGGSKSPTTTYPDANGIGAFYYQPPTGALALCTANLPDFTPTVTDDTPQDYFKTMLYTGNGGTQSITGVGFQPDLVWAKNRTITGANHRLFDSVRGPASNLYSSTTNAAVNDPTGLTSFDSGGFSIGATSVNDNNANFVAWCWKAGGNSNTFNINGTGYSTYSALQTANTSLPASSTSGMIVPSGMSINTDAGFSIVKYPGTGSTGGTVPHGLDKKPDIVIIKNLDDGTKSWNTTSFITTPSTVLTADTFNIGSKTGGVLALNTTSLASAYTIDGQTSGNEQNHIAYCWHSVEGYSKFGSYTGNGSADGPFVYCGFRPAWVMIKKTDGAATWWIVDSSRDEYNPTKKYLQAESANAESAGSSDYVTADFVSNGFKIRNTSVSFNSGNHIFMAFAEQPFKYANAR